MKVIELERYKKVNICFDNIPELNIKKTKSLNYSFEANSSLCDKRRVVLELQLPLNASYYGLLGARFKPQAGSGSLNIEVRYVDMAYERYHQHISYPQDPIFKGLHEEYVHAVLDAATAFLEKSNQFPRGTLTFDLSAYSDVGSSQMIFRLITKMIMVLIFNKDYPAADDEIKKICESILAERFQH